MNIFNNKIVKYAILTAIILALFMTLFNNTRLGHKEGIMMSLIIILAFIVIENLCNFFSGEKKTENILSEGFAGLEPYKLPEGYPAFIPHDQSEGTPLEQVGGDLFNIGAAEKVAATATKVEEEESKSESKEESKSEESPSVESKTEETKSESVTIESSPSEEKKPVYKSDVRLAKANAQEREGCRWKDDVMVSDMKFTDYNHLPLAEGYDSRDYEYGFSFLPPEKWYPQPPYPPVCVTNKRNDVMPMFTNGAPMDVKEWNSSLRVTSPDNINVDFIKGKLNSGR